MRRRAAEQGLTLRVRQDKNPAGALEAGSPPKGERSSKPTIPEGETMNLHTEKTAVAILGAERDEINARPVIDAEAQERLEVLNMMIAHIEETIEAQEVAV